MRASHSDDLSNGTHFIVFSHQDLDDFLESRAKGVNHNTYGQIRRIITVLWDISQGRITPRILNDYTDYYMAKSKSQDMRDKFYNYAKAFLKYLFKTRMDTNILTLIAIFEKPKYQRERKLLTSRIIVQEDIEKAIAAIDNDPALPAHLKLRYKTTLAFLAYSGQRPQTAGKLTVSQFKEALSREPFVLTVKASQDKIRMEHYVPLHPMLIELIQPLMSNMKDSDNLFTYQGLSVWLKKHPVALSRIQGKLESKDVRKFFEQKSDEIGFTDANKNFIMSHGVSSINWTSYKQYLPENVYKKYLEYWGSVVIQ